MTHLKSTTWISPGLPGSNTALSDAGRDRHVEGQMTDAQKIASLERFNHQLIQLVRRVEERNAAQELTIAELRATIATLEAVRDMEMGR